MLNNRLFLSLRRKFSKNIISSSVQMKLPNAPIDQYVMEKWHKSEDKVAIECGVSGKRLTYLELRHRSKSLGVGLAQLGFKKKTALLAMPTCPEYPIALLGALQAGMTVSPASPRCSAKDLKNLIADAGVRCVLTTPEYLNNIQSAVKGSEIAVMCTGQERQEGVISFEQLSNIRDPYEVLLPTIEEKMDQFALLAYSTGIRLRHSNITADIEQISHPKVNILSESSDKHQDVVLAVQAFSHIYGVTLLVLKSLKMGAKIICLPKFRPEDFLRLLSSNKDAVLQGGPTLMNFLANDDRVTSELLKDVRVITYRDADCNLSDLEKLAAKEPRIVFQGYGELPQQPIVNKETLDSEVWLNIGDIRQENSSLLTG